MTPPKPTMQESLNDPSTKNETTQCAFVNLMTPPKPTTQKTLNDLSTPNKTTIQGEVSSKYGYPADSELEENWDLLLDKTKKHTNAQKRGMMETVVIDQLYFHHSSYKLMTCEVCHRYSSFPTGALFMIPNVSTILYNLLLRTPKDVKDLPVLREK